MTLNFIMSVCVRVCVREREKMEGWGTEGDSSLFPHLSRFLIRITFSYSYEKIGESRNSSLGLLRSTWWGQVIKLPATCAPDAARAICVSLSFPEAFSNR